ncbi:hypothetical protein EG835_08375 [bacterium]|nr:hypothetical protein [bacterium]
MGEGPYAEENGAIVCDDSLVNALWTSIVEPSASTPWQVKHIPVSPVPAGVPSSSELRPSPGARGGAVQVASLAAV